MHSATQIAAQNRIDISMHVINTAGINVQQWNLILFEVGCQFVEKWVKQPALQKCLLQNGNLGFWNWWMVAFMDDDNELQQHKIRTLGGYFRSKMMLLDVPELFAQFEYYMKRINIKEVYEKI